MLPIPRDHSMSLASLAMGLRCAPSVSDLLRSAPSVSDLFRVSPMCPRCLCPCGTVCDRSLSSSGCVSPSAGDSPPPPPPALPSDSSTSHAREGRGQSGWGMIGRGTPLQHSLCHPQHGESTTLYVCMCKCAPLSTGTHTYIYRHVYQQYMYIQYI